MRLVVTQIVFETHSFSEDNERGVATGWLPGLLSARGRAAARELGARRGDDHLAAVFASDLRRAAETVSIAFEGSRVPVLLDWRLRECDYGDLNGSDSAHLHEHRLDYLDVPYPNGESWSQAVARVGRFLDDVGPRWQDRRILIVGHMATRFGLEHFLAGVPLADLLGEAFAWQEGWEYSLTSGRA
jgi:broad specificity phosphatase PhoE